MSYVMPEIAVQRLVQYGIQYIRNDRALFDEIFSYLADDALTSVGYGTAYLDRVWVWFTTEKIPVIQAFVLSPERIPCFSVHLASESEDESKAAIGDFYGDEDEDEMMVNASSVTLDIGIHGSKVAEQVLWMYYILSDILFRHKGIAQNMGIEIHTFSASDWSKDSAKQPENVYTRWVKMRMTVFNTWKSVPFEGPYDVVVEQFGASSPSGNQEDVENVIPPVIPV